MPHQVAVQAEEDFAERFAEREVEEKAQEEIQKQRQLDSFFAAHKKYAQGHQILTGPVRLDHLAGSYIVVECQDIIKEYSNVDMSLDIRTYITRWHGRHGLV